VNIGGVTVRPGDLVVAAGKPQDDTTAELA